MVKWKMIPVSLAVVGVLVSAGGCVSQATHQKVLSKLSETEANLNLAQQHNMQLRGGLNRLAQQCEVAAMQAKSIGPVLERIKAGQKRTADCLIELQRVCGSQAGVTAALEDTVIPLAGQIDKLGKTAAALADNKPVPTTSAGPSLAAYPAP